MADGFDKLLRGGGAPAQGSSGGFDSLLGSGPSKPAQPTESSFLSNIPGAHTALSVAAPVLDFLSRGQYASAGFFDALLNDNASVLDALGRAGSELLSSTKRLGFSDVLRRSNPEFAANNPLATKAIGFLGDIALDPTTYLGLGLGAATKGARIGGRALSTLGETLRAGAIERLAGQEITTGLGRAAERGLFSQLGPSEAAQVLGRESLARLPKEIAEGARFGAAETAEGVLKQTTESVGNDIRAVLGGKLPPGVTEQGLDDLAGQISLERLGLPNAQAAADSISTLTRRLDYGELLESADDLINRVAAMSPETSRAIFQPGGLKLTVGIPLTPLQSRISLITPEMIKAVGLDRLDGVVKAVAGLPGIKQAINAGKVVRGAFDRFYDLDHEYIKTIAKLQNEWDFIKGDVVRDVRELVEGTTKESREKISKVINGFQAGVESLDDAERAVRAPEIFQMALRTTPLDPKERAITMSLLQGYGRAAELERAAGIAGQQIANFDPRVYNAIGGSAEEAEKLLSRVGPDGIDAAGLTGQELQKATDLAAAIRDGASPEMDAVLLYVQRAIQARQTLPRKQAMDALETLFGKDPAKWPKRVLNDWRYFGEMRFPTFAGDETSDILGALDWIQRKWKISKTALNPSFAPKQLVQNSLQAALVSGNNAARAFDPRTYSAAARIVMGKSTRSAGLAETAAQWLQKYVAPEDLEMAAQLAGRNVDRAREIDDLARGMSFTLPTGQKLSREEVELLARQNGILRGTSAISGEALKRSLQDEIGLGARTDLSGKAFAGTKALVEGYLGLSSKVEDTSRLALFINTLMTGASPRQAAETVNRALFDYGRSFSRFENEVLKRIVPFYSFNRLAIPFVLRETLENPGAAATANKVSELIGKVVSGDEKGQPATLSPAEREIFGRSYLIDQPRIYTGMDKDGRALFNIFNNITPFDALSLFTVTRKDGEIDYRRTAEKNILGMLSPFLKIPAEVIANRDFFTGKVIEDARGYGGKGRLGSVKDTALDRVLPEAIKEMIGWEWGRDRKTGQPVAYVNPYFAYTLAQVAPPVARQFFKPLGDSESVVERAMKMLIGVGQPSIDLRESLDIQNTEDRRFIQEARQKVVAASRTGRLNSMEQALDDYRRILRTVGERRARIAQGGPVRGRGIEVAPASAEGGTLE
ncbi:MAG TPA: hypothetical protein VJ302_16755 [Blastocatellia bacterium]|nr:hypothetical protein [Blastocatellia bacterium]